MAYQGTPSYSGAPASQYSDWIHRGGAYLIEELPFIVVYSTVGLTAKIILICLVALLALVYTIYNRWILGGQGQSIGKKVLGMMLISEETGQPIGTLNAFLRDICHIVDSIICYIGYLFPLWDPKRQTIADQIMKPVVVPVNQQL